MNMHVLCWDEAHLDTAKQCACRIVSKSLQRFDSHRRGPSRRPWSGGPDIDLLEMLREEMPGIRKTV